MQITLKTPNQLNKKERAFLIKTMLNSSNLIFKISYLLNKVKLMAHIDANIAIFKEKKIIGMIIYKERQNNEKDREGKFLKNFDLKDINIFDIDFLFCEKKGCGSKILKLFEETVKTEKCSFVLYTEKDFKKLEGFYLKNGYKILFKKNFPKNVFFFKNYGHEKLKDSSKN